MAAVHLSHVEFSDEYVEPIRSKEPLTMEDLLSASNALDFPIWITCLMRIRDSVVRWFGLKTAKEIHSRNTSGFRLFNILSRTHDEVIAGEDDRHLNFRVVIRLVQDTPGVHLVSFKTLVQFNNLAGRIYFIPVKPFHKIIVPALLRRLSRQLATG